MRKTPSYLKGLAETRARAAGDVLRLQQILDQVKESLAKAQAEVEACDVLIKKFDDRLEPTESPRELRRLHYLREWSDEQDEKIFT